MAIERGWHLPNTFAAGSFRAKTFTVRTLAGVLTGVVVPTGKGIAIGALRKALVRLLLAHEYERLAAVETALRLRKIEERVTVTEGLQRQQREAAALALQEAQRTAAMRAAGAVLLAEV